MSSGSYAGVAFCGFEVDGYLPVLGRKERFVFASQLDPCGPLQRLGIHVSPSVPDGYVVIGLTTKYLIATLVGSEPSLEDERMQRDVQRFLIPASWQIRSNNNTY